MRGLLTDNLSVLDAMDEELEETKKSLIVPVELKKDGTPTSASKAVPNDDLEILQRYVHRKLEHAGNEIFSGTTTINPFSLKNRTACKYCSFKSVCQFDVTEGDQQYKQLKAAKPKEILETIKKELNVHEEDDTE